MYDTFISQPGKKNVQVDPYGTRQLSTFAPDICAVGRRDALVAFQDASKGQNDIRAVHMRGGTKRGPRAPRGRRRLRGPATPGGRGWRARWQNVLALWEDERDGPAQIYFARAKLRKPPMKGPVGLELSRRDFLRDTSALGLAALIASAVPVADRILAANPAYAAVSDRRRDAAGLRRHDRPRAARRRGPTSATRSIPTRSPASTTSRAPSRPTCCASTTTR